jgi:hypothetical protein
VLLVGRWKGMNHITIVRLNLMRMILKIPTYYHTLLVYISCLLLRGQMLNGSLTGRWSYLFMIYKWSTNVLKDCTRSLYYYYIVFAGESIYLKKWSCRYLQRGFFHSHYSNRTNCGGKRWELNTIVIVGKSGKSTVWFAKHDWHFDKNKKINIFIY